MKIIVDYCFTLIQEMWSLCLEMSPYLLLGMFVSGLIFVFIDSSIIYKQIGDKNFLSILKSTLFGIPLPLCSCGVIPVAATLRESGASKGSTVSFLVSTPQTGVDSIFLTYGMLGPVFALFRPLAALFSGLFSGVVINNIDNDEHHHLPNQDTKKRDSQSLIERVLEGLNYGFVSLPADIVVPLFQGLVIAAGISVFIPPDLIANHFAANPFLQYVMMLAISIPLYVCATASIPIAVALMAKGISPGAVFVFLMAGPATNASSIAVIKNILGKQTLYYYLGLIGSTAIVFGVLLDSFVFKILPIMPTAPHHHHDYGEAFRLLLTFLFIIILINAYLSRFKKVDEIFVNDSQDSSKLLKPIVITVEGMTCGHCKESVESIVNGFSSVEEASVDLLSGKVILKGIDIEVDLIKEKIIARGFSVK